MFQLNYDTSFVIIYRISLLSFHQWYHWKEFGILGLTTFCNLYGVFFFFLLSFLYSFQVDLLTDIARAPRILTNFAGAIQPANFKKVLFVFSLLSGRYAMLDDKGKGSHQ